MDAVNCPVLAQQLLKSMKECTYQNIRLVLLYDALHILNGCDSVSSRSIEGLVPTCMLSSLHG
jgi:hypothetical protein